MKNLSFLLLAALFFSSCSNSNQHDESTDTTTETVASTSYEYQRAFTKITWTAYKTMAKVGVSGSFNEFNVTPGSDSSSIKGMLNQLQFSIPVATTNSNNEERDQKLVATFFGSMMNTENIEGSFANVQGNDSAGTMGIIIKMNDVSHEITGNYMVENNKIKITADMHLGDWKAESSVDALNKVCEDLHTGEDGVSKLWPDVALEIESTLREVTHE